MRAQIPLPDLLLNRVSETLAAQIGLHYPRHRWPDLERGLAAAARRFGMDSAEACARSLLAAPLNRRQIEVLAGTLTVGETYFFRERRSFEVLEQEIIPELLRVRERNERPIRIWSAGCATGEEAYSIAILLARTIPDLAAWNVSILATDIAPEFLRKASLGIYTEWSFRDVPAAVKAAYFTRTPEGRLQIAPHIKSLVTFAYLNLVDDNYPSVENGTNAMDIIFCRNVLIYFEQARGREVLRKLGRCLLEDGWLFVNPIEAAHVAVPDLQRVDLSGVIAYRKVSASADTERHTSASARAALPMRERISPPAALEGVHGRAAEETPRKPAFKPPSKRKRAESAAQALREAAASYAQGRYRDAVEKLMEIIARKPNDSAALVLLVRAYADQGSLDEARQWCEKALEADKLNAGWCYLLSTILQEQGRGEDAVSALRRALYLDPRHALAHFAIGNLTRRQGKLAEAERHFRNALALLGDYPQEEILPDSEGITAGRLAEIIRSTVLTEART